MRTRIGGAVALALGAGWAGGCGDPFDNAQACVLARAWLHDNSVTTEIL